MRFEQKVALVTGGTKGIGGETAVALAAAGANVAIVARHTDDAVQKRIQSLGRQCIVIAGDVAKPPAALAAVQRTVAELGAVDIVVHAAGGLVGGGLMDVSDTAWMDAFDVHVHAAFHLARAAAPVMKTRGEGSIVLISSVAGIRGLKTAIAYQVVKGALPQMTRALAYELAASNIRVNCVAPGIIRTDFHAAMPEAVKQNNLDNRIPLKREGTPQQVAGLIKELIGNDYITGETVTIDGGLTMRIC
jgi:NAD(P)-dependent dehydrogenase (short-subunit alcohol dehydrogenase family)